MRRAQVDGIVSDRLQYRMVVFRLLAALWVAVGVVAPSAPAPAPAPAPPPTAFVAEPRFVDHQRQYSTEDGLPQNSVNAMLVDHEGFLWLATFDGVARFDGVNFTVLRALADQGPASNRILSLLEDPAHRLWVGTEDAGISVREGATFRHLAVCQSHCRVAALLQQGDRTLAVTDQGLWLVDAALNTATRIGPTVNLLWAVQDSHGNVFVANHSQIWQVQDASLTAVPLPETAQLLGFAARVDDELWVGNGSSLFRRHAGQWTAVALPLDLGSITFVGRLATQLWVGNAAGTVFVFDAHNQLIGEPRQSYGQLQHAFVDRDQNIWLGTLFRGLFQIRPARISLLNAHAGGFDLPGLPVLGDGHQGQWLGLNCDGLRHRSADGSVRSWPMLGALRDACPWALYQDQGTFGERLWIGTAAGRLGFLESSASDVQEFYAWPSKALVHSIARIDASTLWVAVGDATYRVDANDRSKAPVAIAALQGVTVARLRPARRGGMWVTSDQGVFRVVGEQIVERWGPLQGLSSRFARALWEGSDGTLWIGTYGGGVNVVRDGKLKVYNNANGLHDATVSCILEDHLGQLWLSGNRGISMVSTRARDGAGQSETLDVIAYSKADGLVPEEANGVVDPACYRDSDNRLWFSLIAGFAIVDPAHAITLRTDAAGVTIERVSIAGHQVAFARNITLGSGDRDVEVTFTTPALAAPERAVFRFRTAPDSAWVALGGRRSVFLSELRWGHSELQIQTRIADGPWSPATTLSITRPRPWYRNPLVWGGLVACLVAAVLLARYFLLRYLRTRREHAESLQRANAELGAQARRDALTGLANRREFSESLAAAWSARADRQVAILMVDVDQFKLYNDHFGHIVGDECLVRVAAALQSVVQPPDLVARYGGEEFVVLMPNANVATATRLGEALRCAVEAMQIEHMAAAIHSHVTVSIGCSLSLGSDEVPLTLMSRADTALYAAKKAGRNQVRSASGRTRPGDSWSAFGRG